MTFDELVEKLKDMRKNPKYKNRKHRAIIPSLFGIRYAEEIRRCGRTPAAIAQHAIGEDSSYGTEIGKGINLSNYVELKQDVVL